MQFVGTLNHSALNQAKRINT